MTLVLLMLSEVLMNNVYTELTIGRVLGRGGFCVVSEINSMTLKGSATSQDTTAKKKDTCYAIKQLSEDRALKDANIYVNGIVDLAMEAKWLASIQHPNIIQIRGISNKPPYSRNFFIILDRLYDILTLRLQTWKKHRPDILKKVMHRNCKQERAIWLERITVAHDVASALAHLHSHNVIHRDLKPDDIGFNSKGNKLVSCFLSTTELFYGLSLTLCILNTSSSLSPRRRAAF